MGNVNEFEISLKGIIYVSQKLNVFVETDLCNVTKLCAYIYFT